MKISSLWMILITFACAINSFVAWRNAVQIGNILDICMSQQKTIIELQDFYFLARSDPNHDFIWDNGRWKVK